MTTLARLQGALSALGLGAVEARVETLLERAAKQEPAYADFLLEVVSAEVEARRQRYLKTRLQLAHLPFVRPSSSSISRSSLPLMSGRSASCARCGSSMRLPM